MTYRFGPFVLVPESRELFGQGVARSIEPQVFDLLHYLVRERQRVVARSRSVAERRYARNSRSTFSTIRDTLLR